MSDLEERVAWAINRVLYSTHLPSDTPMETMLARAAIAAMRKWEDDNIPTIARYLGYIERAKHEQP